MHPAVAEVAVIGLQDAKWGERPLALIVPKKDTDAPTEASWSSHVNQFIEKGLLSKQAMLVKVKVVEAIDKTSVGKINKRLLREKYPV
jgi:fatty-acyl-CoA synthase